MRIQDLGGGMLVRSIILCCLVVYLSAESAIRYIDFRTERIVLGICPSVGGRIYKMIGDGQVFSVWNEALLYHWNRAGEYPYHLYGGSELWISPQSGWNRPWPPNLSLGTNEWQVLEQREDAIHLQSIPEVGDVWRGDRTIRLLGPDSFEQTISLTNISNTEQQTGIWLMNRCPIEVQVLVPADSIGKDERSASLLGDLDSAMGRVVDHAAMRAGKVYYHSQEDRHYLKRAGVTWQVVTRFTPSGPPHDDQGAYELARPQGLLEVERHGPQCRVVPGASISVVETWTLLAPVAESD